MREDFSQSIAAAQDYVQQHPALCTSEFVCPFVDLTNLSEAPDNLDALVQHAAMPPKMAGVCIPPQWVLKAKRIAGEREVCAVTVANFPDGACVLPQLKKDLLRAMDSTAEEIDVVLPYATLLAGQTGAVQAFLKCAREKTRGRILKIILETAALQNTDKIQLATELCVDAGADFVKTSTGKLAQSDVNFGQQTGASLPAAAAMLHTLKACQQTHPNAECGFKASGGIRDLETAGLYLALAITLMGEAWVTPKRMRIGTSQFF